MTVTKTKFAYLIWAFVIESKKFNTTKNSFKLIPWWMAHLMLRLLCMMMCFTHSSHVECLNVNYGACFSFSIAWFEFHENNVHLYNTKRGYVALWIKFPRNTQNFFFFFCFWITFHENKLKTNNELKCIPYHSIFRFSYCFSFILLDICFQFA